jgi:hypothetical protein
MRRDPGAFHFSLWVGSVCCGVSLVWLGQGQRSAKPSDTLALSEINEPETDSPSTLRRYLVLMFVVVPINLTWQFFRAWLPKFLKEAHGYGEAFANYFTSAN